MKLEPLEITRSGRSLESSGERIEQRSGVADLVRADRISKDRSVPADPCSLQVVFPDRFGGGSASPALLLWRGQFTLRNIGPCALFLVRDAEPPGVHHDFLQDALCLGCVAERLQQLPVANLGFQPDAAFGYALVLRERGLVLTERLQYPGAQQCDGIGAK